MLGVLISILKVLHWASSTVELKIQEQLMTLCTHDSQVYRLLKRVSLDLTCRDCVTMNIW